MEVFNNTLGITNRIASTDLRMEDLLQAQFENQASLSLFNGLAKVNISLLLYQINKKWVPFTYMSLRPDPLNLIFRFYV